jgi:hypothetical protein
MMCGNYYISTTPIIMLWLIVYCMFYVIQAIKLRGENPEKPKFDREDVMSHDNAKNTSEKEKEINK